MLIPIFLRKIRHNATLSIGRILRKIWVAALQDTLKLHSNRVGTAIIKVLVVYQMIHTEKLRGLIRTITEHTGLPAALGGTVARNTLANGTAQRDDGQRVEAWMGILQTYGPWLERWAEKRFSYGTGLFGITRFYTDDGGAYEPHIEPEKHIVEKENTQKIERKNLTFRTRIKRLVRKTICFSKKILCTIV